jgi:GT2 family glycosyltransferase
MKSARVRDSWLPLGRFRRRWDEAKVRLVAAWRHPFNREKRRRRRRGHIIPSLPPVVRPERAAVAIIIVSFGSPDATELTLLSIQRARTTAAYRIYVVENGSSAEVKDRIRNFVNKIEATGTAIEYIDSSVNLGFSGGNNLAIRRATTAGCSHYCLLNSDVVVTDDWLDLLLATGERAISPVSNAVGNEQTVPIDYQAQIDEAAIDKANRFARKWRDAFDQKVVYSDEIGFFCFLFASYLVDTVGYLDESFFPGGFEDNDYCIRLRGAGVDLAIARHVFVHHFGSQSFAAFPMSHRLRVSSENLDRFQRKHGVHWIDWQYKVVSSWAQDATRLRSAGRDEGVRSFQRTIMEAHARMAEGATKGLAYARSAERDLRLQREALLGILASLRPRPSIPAYVMADPAPERITMRSPVRDSDVPLHAAGADEVAKLFYAVCDELTLAGHPSFEAAASLRPIIAALAPAWRDGDPIAVSAREFDPIWSDEKDGYVQRVRAIDLLMADRTRLYLKFHQAGGEKLAVTWATPQLAIVDIGSSDPEVSAFVRAILRESRCIYIHSILAAADERLLLHIAKRQTRTILDAHGAVPEEADMYLDFVGRDRYEALEKAVMKDATAVVAVTQSMLSHLRGKHSSAQPKMFLLPIFPEIAEQPDAWKRPPAERPVLIYAGGAQKWQCISRMARAIAQLHATCDFILLTPNVAQVAQELIDAGVPAREARGNVNSVSQRQVPSFYRKAHYGFLLRDDSVVNHVACPTKVVEYIAAGVVPILHSENVGDFCRLGMRFLPLADLLAGNIPSWNVRDEMARDNLRVLARLKESAATSSRELISLWQ